MLLLNIFKFFNPSCFMIYFDRYEERNAGIFFVRCIAEVKDLANKSKLGFK